MIENIVDSHRHFWEISRFNYEWMSPADKIIYKDFLPESYPDISQENGVTMMVAIQAHQSVDETKWLLEMADEVNFIAGVVGWVDLQSESLETQLSELCKHQKFKGVRHVVQDEPQDDWVLRPDVIRGIRSLAQYDLSYDILIFPRHLKYIPTLVEACPDVRFVIDHLAKPPISSGAIGEWAAGLKAVATFPQVFCKLSGLVTEADHASWTPDDLRPYAESALEFFGADRLMFGTDYPVCLLAATYENVLKTYRGFLDNLTDAEQKQVMGENAKIFYRL